jgi:hypothetical protein
VHIDDDDVGAACGNGADRIAAIGHVDGIEAGVGQGRDHQVAELRFVIHHQNTHTGLPLPSWIACRHAAQRSA